jgi:carbohydrate-binding DOMON domain-containing protein
VVPSEVSPHGDKGQVSLIGVAIASAVVAAAVVVVVETATADTPQVAALANEPSSESIPIYIPFTR